MQFLRLNSIALAIVSVNAAVLPRQETSTSLITSIPNTSATKKSYLTSITTLPMPTSVEGDTAYPTSTPAVAVTTAALSSTFPTTSTQPPFTWNNNATATNVTTSLTNVTTSSTSIFATGLSDSTGNVTASGMNSTGVISSTKAPYANSTTNGLIGGVAATGTAVIVTGLTAANATAAPNASSANSTRPAPAASTSMLVQLYLVRPSTLAANKASETEVPLGSNMTLVVDDDDEYKTSSSTSRAKATVALFSNSTTAAGVAQATGVKLSTATASKKNNNATISAAPAHATSTSTVQFSNITMTTVTVKPNPTHANNSTLAAFSNTTTSSSTKALSTASSHPIANGITSNGTMLAVTYDNKNGTIVQLVSASNSTNSLSATGTAAASASASLDRRNLLSPEQTAAPITPVAAKQGAWSRLAYARTEYLPRPGRFFGGEGWGVKV